MTAATLIRQLADTGIRLSVEGDKLQVEAAPGALTPELRTLLVNRKADLVAELSGVRGRLLALTAQHDLDAGLVHELAQVDVDACTGLADKALLAHLHALADDAERKAGRVPAGDTAAVLCRSCGPVYLHPSIAAVLPAVNGWPRALGCPWCFIQKVSCNMAIPRPQVTCGSCQHFIPDPINQKGGAGGCKLGIQPKRTPLPFTAQYCGSYRPLSCNTASTPT